MVRVRVSGANSLVDRIPITAHEVVQIREQEQRHEHEQGHGQEQVDIYASQHNPEYGKTIVISTRYSIASLLHES